MGQRSYKDLQVWQKAIDFVTVVYRLTEKFPSTETYGLALQLRRASVSVPSNIAEGSAKRSSIDFTRFINIARGSIAEIETQLIIAERLKYITEIELKSVSMTLEEINKMLFGLGTSLETRNPKLKIITPKL